ncbi:MAG: arginine decarboxylase, pyruvoyl-dependent [Firmicutes bacterium]|nr:arginine decarboxylase, pyruvoyl-dependent [Bacillota bacterium]
MLSIPVRFTLRSGYGEAETPLNAFDVALLAAGMGDLNLLKVSTILPPGAVYTEELDIAPGSLVPTAYATLSSQMPGTRITAAVAVGLPADAGCGVIMACSGHCSREEIEERITAMVEEAFAMRQRPLREIRIAAVEHVVEKCGSVFAGVALWY